jgi:hypothetical protein
MNCDTYLAMLATLPVDELAYGNAREHAAGCRDCDRVTRVVVERERNLVVAYNDLYPPLRPEPIAARALDLSRRRRIAFYFRLGLGIATAVVAFMVFAVRRTVPRPPGQTVTETIRLGCLSPDQAMEVLRLHASPSVSVEARPSAVLGVVQVVAPPGELARVRSMLAEYDTPRVSQCGLQVTVPKDAQEP